MKGRAATTEQKRAVLARLLDVWLAQPHLRLGQMVFNVFADEKSVYYVEDDDLADHVEAFYRSPR